MNELDLGSVPNNGSDHVRSADQGVGPDIGADPGQHDDAYVVAPPTVTLGQYRDNPVGQLHALDEDRLVESYKDAIERHNLPEAWHSPARFKDNSRSAANWTAAIAAVVDIDYQDEHGTHTTPPSTMSQQATDLLREPRFLFNLVHQTPRGLRGIVVFKSSITDSETWTRVASCIMASISEGLEQAGLTRRQSTAGFIVDPASRDRSHFWWGPKTSVNAVPRDNHVLVLRPQPASLADFIGGGAAPGDHDPEDDAPRVQSRSVAREGRMVLHDPAQKWINDHGNLASAWPNGGGTCPTCRHKQCFNRMPDDPLRWCCWSANHGRDSGSCGRRCKTSGGALIWAGDVLDIEAHRRGVDRTEVLRQDGYLADQGIAASTGDSGHREPRYPPPGDPFPIEHLPQAVRRYVSEASTSIGCAPELVIQPMLAMLGSCIGMTRAVRIKHGWTEPCIFWTICVADSGQQKSPAFAAAVRPLGTIQRRWFTQYEEDCRAYGIAKLQYEKDLQEWKRKGNRGTQPPEAPAEPTCKQLLVDDATMEALGSVLNSNHRGVLVARDELSGWFMGFDAYRSGRGGDVARFLAGHRGEAFTVNRKSAQKVIHIHKAGIAITGGVQPHTLKYLVAGSRRSNDGPGEHLSNGLMARFVAAFPARSTKRWTDQEISVEASSAMAILVQRLLELDFQQGADGEELPVELQFTARAREKWIEFYDLHAREGDRHHGEMASAWAKLEGYAARFSLLFALVEGSTEVDVHHVEAATAITRWYAEEAHRIYTFFRVAAEESPATRQQRLAYRLLVEKKVMTARDLQRASRAFKTADEANTALNALVKSGSANRRRVNADGHGRDHDEFALAGPSEVRMAPPESDASVSSVSVDAGGVSPARAHEQDASDCSPPSLLGSTVPSIPELQSESDLTTLHPERADTADTADTGDPRLAPGTRTLPAPVQWYVIDEGEEIVP